LDISDPSSNPQPGNPEPNLDNLSG